MGPRRVLCIPARTHTPDASCLTPHSTSGPPCHRRRGTTPASLLTSSHRRRLRRSRASRRRTHAQKIARIDHGTEMIIRQRREKAKQQDKRQSDSTCLAQHSHIPPPRRTRRLGCSPLRSIRHKLGCRHISSADKQRETTPHPRLAKRSWGFLFKNFASLFFHIFSQNL